MSESASSLREVIAAETAAAEAAIAAQKLRGIGAWFAYAAASELATVRRAKADRIRAGFAQRTAAT